MSASVSATITVNPGSAAAVSFNGAIPTLTAPVAPGTDIQGVSVTSPSGWQGSFSLSGPNASSFAMSGNTLQVGSSPLAAGSYSVTITATP